MDQVLFLSPGVFGEQKPYEPIQQECNIDEDEWLLLEFKEDQAHKPRYLFVKEKVDQGDIEIQY